MQYLLKKAIILLISLFILLITTLIYTLLIYNQKIDSSTAGIYRSTFIIGAVIFFVYGLITGIIEKKKGFLSSFLSSLIIVSIIVLVKILSKEAFLPTNLIKYGVYVLTASIGGIIGVNLGFKKKKKKV